jgi:TolB-like protein/Flp pilus assembly protein TadD
MDSRRWEEIQSVFDALVQLNDVERANRLSALGRKDPKLRAAVELLLAADAEVEARLAPIEAVFLAPNATTPDSLGLAGRNISHFQIREPIGAGGMGVVYRADDTSLGRAVALKFLLPAYSVDPGAKARFLREAHSAAALDHPNLCNVYEIGTSDNGHLFLAMALYEGETLKARLAREGRLPLSEALEIARQVAEGLGCAHAAGIVHRDLKPGNMMLLPDKTIKILDFGLAKVRDQSITETGARFGTVSYMSPEQIRGEKTDARSDLWSVGAVLYEMLTGRKPFGAEQDIAVAHSILHDEPVPPSNYRRDLPAELEEFVLRLLEKDPADRYANASEALSELTRTESEGFGHALRRRLRRASHVLSHNRRRALAVVALLAVAAAAYAATERRSATAPVTPARTTIAVLPFHNLGAADSNAYLANGLQDEILTQLLKVPALRVIGRNSVMSYTGPNTPPVRQIARELGAGALVEGSVQVVGRRVRVNVQLTDPFTEQPLWVERYDRTLDDVFAIQNDIAAEIVATVGAAVTGRERTAMVKVPTEKAQAYLFYMRAKDYERRPGRQKENFEAAIGLYEQALALDPNFALARAALSVDHGQMYWMRYDMTPERLKKQRSQAEMALQIAPDLAEAHLAMAIVHNVGPETDVRAGQREARIGLRAAPNDVRLLKSLAASHRRLGEWEEYDKAFAKAVESDPRDIDFLRDYGAETHARMGRFADAIRWYDRAKSLLPAQDTMGFTMAQAWTYVTWKGHLDSVRAVLNSKEGLALRGKRWVYPYFALQYFERRPDSALRALTGAPNSVFEGTLSFEPVSLWVARCHLMRGDTAAAHAAFDSALVTIDSAIVKWPEDWPIHEARGHSLAGLGRRAEALAEIRAMRESFIYRKDAFLRHYIGIGMARVFAELGDANSAVDELDRVMSQPRNGFTVHRLRLEPAWDRVRDHPRFRALLTKYAN